MRILMSATRRGKTTRLIGEWRKTLGCLIVATYAERMRITREYQLTGEEAARVFVAGDRQSLQDFHPGQPVYVDNADWILSAFIGRELTLVTMGGTDK